MYFTSIILSYYFALYYMCTMLCILGDKPSTSSQYIYIDTQKEICTVFRYNSEKLIVYSGLLDENGDFNTNIHTLPSVYKDGSPMFLNGWSMRFLMEGGSHEPVYELLSNRLIPGKLSSKRFVPDLVGGIISIKDYKLESVIKRIYNLPGEINKSVDGVLWKKDVSQGYYYFCGNVRYHGHLDADGHFLPSTETLPVVFPTSTKPAHPENSRERYLYQGDEKEEAVYEFRVGRLIPGTLKGGYFMPDAGPGIKEFKDYQYNPSFRRIYNLPGRYIKIERLQFIIAELQKSWLALILGERYRLNPAIFSR